MMRKIICLALIFLMPFGASAWWARGHMVVAALAYLELNQEAQQQVIALLKHHPEYERLWKKEYPKYQKKVDLGAFLMMRASVWADEIKNKKHPYYPERRNHWHYITYRIEFPDQHDMTLPDGAHVVSAIQETHQKLMDTSLDKAQRAVNLAWLIHLIGDVHQPLHCASEFSDIYPDGDLGGNLQYVKPKRKVMKMHGLWDSALGTKSHHRQSVNQAILLRKTNASMEFSASLDAVAWSKESFQHAVETVHANGELATYTEKKIAARHPKLNSQYLKDMKSLAAKRGYMAGVRLAEAVKELKL